MRLVRVMVVVMVVVVVWGQGLWTQWVHNKWVASQCAKGLVLKSFLANVVAHPPQAVLFVGVVTTRVGAILD
jgi:hypothetical protein